MDEIKFTRKELYDLVWSQPLSVLARKYNISDNGLRKICIKSNIPLPENGYWQKIRYGKPVNTKLLSENYSGKNVIVLNEREIDLDGDTFQVVNIQIELEKEIELNSSLPLRVPDRLTNPDRLTTNTIKYYEAVSKFDYRNGIEYPSRNEVLNIDVQKASMSRAIRFMDTLIKLLRTRNHGIKFHNNKTIVVVDGEEIEFRLRERMRVSGNKDSFGGRILENTGEFIFIIGDYRRKELNEKKATLETKLPTILAIIELEGKRLKEERIEHERRRKIQEEKERIAKEILARKEKEFADFKKLFKLSKRHEEAEVIRRYIQKLEDFAISRNELTDTIKEKIAWARKKADWYDPFIESEDELLIDVNREDLTMKKQGYW
jgi:hypothetical protein